MHLCPHPYSDYCRRKIAVEIEKKSANFRIVLSEETNEARLSQMSDSEFIELTDRMTAFTVNYLKGRRWRNGASETLPKGETAQSIVQMAFEKLIAGAKWDEGKPAWLILKGIIQGRVQSLVNSPENKNLIDCDDQVLNETLEARSPALIKTDQIDAAEENESEDRILGIIDELETLGKEEEKKVVEAILNGNDKRADILQETGFDVKTYEAVKKRLRRFLEKFRQEATQDHH